MINILEKITQYFFKLKNEALFYYGGQPKGKIKDYNKIVKESYKNRKIRFILIETINRCNNNCNFCPVSVGNEKRDFKKMSYEMFNKIIDDLVKINYDGSIALFFTNEPFLDDRIIDFMKIVKDRLPNAFHYIMTNGILLTL
ncbi:hypothetical protein SZ51_13220, partial [Brachyspira hyodysenteriae]